MKMVVMNVDTSTVSRYFKAYNRTLFAGRIQILILF
jgi:hypothetical protein